MTSHRDHCREQCLPTVSRRAREQATSAVAPATALDSGDGAPAPTRRRNTALAVAQLVRSRIEGNLRWRFSTFHAGHDKTHAETHADGDPVRGTPCLHRPERDPCKRGGRVGADWVAARGA